MRHEELTSLVCARPQNFAWFLGAGASATAGLPTAGDIIQDLKRRYYCREESQDIQRQDMQNPAVRARIQAFMQSRGFPEEGALDEYTLYFEQIFGDDKERQRKYLKATLSEDRVSLSVGSRVLGAMMASGLCRAVFTTNFDSVVEKAVAEVAGSSLAAYHLEGAASASRALDNEEYPLYCKLHGDFRYDSLKNLGSDLAEQNQDLSRCLLNAANRFGLVVAGYSGRDASIMDLLHKALDSPNPFPHGLFWTDLKGFSPRPGVEELLDHAKRKGVLAEHVPIDTFDSFMLRVWRNLDNKTPELDAKVRRGARTTVDISIPPPGSRPPIVRLNALPVTAVPQQCLSLTFSRPKDWDAIREAQVRANRSFLVAKGQSVLSWGAETDIRRAFGSDLTSTSSHDLPDDLESPHHLYIKGFLEEALAMALTRGRPLLFRQSRGSIFVIANSHAADRSGLAPLSEVVGATSGEIPGLFSSESDTGRARRQVNWAEAARISVEAKDGRVWLIIDPDLWIWPSSSRAEAALFMDERRADRFNRRYNALLDAWIHVLLGTDRRGAQVQLSPFATGTAAENPVFTIHSRTGFTRSIGR